MIAVKWAARIISLVTTLIFLILLVLSLIHNHMEAGHFDLGIDTLYTFVPFLVTLAGSIVAWWNEKIGGWVLIGGYLLWSITPILYSVTNLSLGFYYDYILAGASLPYLFAGVLFIIYAFRKTKKTA